jgi:hypothetical protein
MTHKTQSQYFIFIIKSKTAQLFALTYIILLYERKSLLGYLIGISQNRNLASISKNCGFVTIPRFNK